MDKAGLIAALKECAVLMELAGENPFKCRAFEQGARVLEGLEGTPADWVASGVHLKTKGIGKGLAERIEEWAAMGELKVLGELRAQVPAGLIEMLQVPGLGTKKIQVLYEKLKLDSLEKLEAAARAGELNALAGFGAKTAEKILLGIQQRRQYAVRHNADAAREAAEKLIERLRAMPQVLRVELAGSLRRWRETAKDVDLVATSSDPAPVMQAFVNMPEVEQIVGHGPTKSSVLLAGGLPVDLRVVDDAQFAAAWLYFTGSKEHNTQLRGRARRMGLKLNEYGLFRAPEAGPAGGENDAEADASTTGELIATPDEAAIYRALGLSYVEPEMREGLSEIAAAETGTLPALITMDDMRGMLHCHTTASDGHQPLAEAVADCISMGYEYIAICDHSQSAAYASGLKLDALERQWAEIDALNKTLKTENFTIFKGIESDILADGQLDYPDEVLAKFDLVVASVHSRMGLDEAAMTARICRALEHPATRILGHPTGRLLLRREPYKLDLQQVFATAARHNVLIEINAHPYRLDLDWRYIREAKAAGCRFAVNPDSHSRENMLLTRYGLGVARKGWLTAEDIINTRNISEFKQWLKSKR
jgi:DNA polymerase (family 10)